MGPALMISILWNDYKFPFQEIKSLWAIKMNNIRWNDNLEIKFKEFELCLVKDEMFIEVIVTTHIIKGYQKYTISNSLITYILYDLIIAASYIISM